MTLYEIDTRLESLIDSETGELLDFDKFMALQMKREEKIENMALWYKNLTAEADAIKAEADKLTERRRANERTAARLKEYIGRALNGEKFSTARCAVTFRRSTSLEVEDADKLVQWAQSSDRDDLLRYKPEIEKKAVTELLNSGVDVPYARLVQKLNVGVK